MALTVFSPEAGVPPPARVEDSSDEEPDVSKQLKIIVVGDGAVGKTSLIQRFCNDHFASSYKQTIGVDFVVKRITLNGKINVCLQIWDIGGQSIGGKMIGNYIHKSDAVLLCYDISSHQSFENLNDWLALVRKNAGSRSVTGPSHLGGAAVNNMGFGNPMSNGTENNGVVGQPNANLVGAVPIGGAANPGMAPDQLAGMLNNTSGMNGHIAPLNMGGLEPQQSLGSYSATLGTGPQGLGPHLSLVGTKADLNHIRAVKATRHQQYSDQQALHANFFVSAKMNDNVELMFHKIAADLCGVQLQTSAEQILQQPIVAEIINHPQNDNAHPEAKVERLDGRPSKKKDCTIM